MSASNNQQAPTEGTSVEHDLNSSLADQGGDVESERLRKKKPPHRPHLPSRDQVRKLVEAVGMAQAAAQLGVDIATLQAYLNGN
ncbi:hypothetical protein GGU10DRAFT_377720 [Lentinula aff. detonsa]|uniref:Uncharacterized protein n=1 Tax=Lentinula aff. detonsa TaxID=2804958 RepID=A0AA38NKZ1_9AGAR|nr:hypothetical protein GGU10DRAFT_377720 [Lentinula aff. detonsa]